MADSTARDAVIIGGGHNGLVCAAYLAAAGLKVTVLERRGVVGGAAVTEEGHPGFGFAAAWPARRRARARQFSASGRHPVPEGRRGQDRTRSGEILRPRCVAAGRLR